MADDSLMEEHTVHERALILLSVADCVKKEGWSDAVAAQLRAAACDLLKRAVVASDAVMKGATPLPDPW